MIRGVAPRGVPWLMSSDPIASRSTIRLMEPSFAAWWRSLKGPRGHCRRGRVAVGMLVPVVGGRLADWAANQRKMFYSNNSKIGVLRGIEVPTYSGARSERLFYLSPVAKEHTYLCTSALRSVT